MGLSCSHLLIAHPKDYTPSAAAVIAFLADIVKLGAIPSPESILLLSTGDRTREVVNPFSGQVEVRPVRNRQEFDNINNVRKAITGLADYELCVSGVGKPTCPPLRIEFNKDYCLSINVIVSSVLRSTSCVHEPPGSESAVPFREPCSLKDAETGRFTNPHNGQTIVVFGAGGSRFWVEFELGKFLAPPISGDRLELLHPSIAELAEKTFGISFVQGCSWG